MRNRETVEAQYKAARKAGLASVMNHEVWCNCITEMDQLAKELNTFIEAEKEADDANPTMRTRETVEADLKYIQERRDKYTPIEWAVGWIHWDDMEKELKDELAAIIAEKEARK